MNLKISTHEGVLFKGAISKITVPTYAWEITVLPWHQPLSSVVKAGVLSFETSESLNSDEYTIKDNKVIMSISKGIILIDGETVVITTSLATSSPSESEEVLLQMKKDMEAELEKIRDDGNAEELEMALENMEKIEADIKLSKLGKI